MRIASLAPAATEIACALGLGRKLCGVSHECDFPPEIAGTPVVTAPLVETTGPSAEIDRAVTEAVARGQPTSGVLVERLAALAPDVVLAQEQCGLCAVTGSGFLQAWERGGRVPPRVVTLQAATLGGIFADIERVAEALGVADRGRELAGAARERLDAVGRRAAWRRSRPRVLVLEWLDPPIVAGHWVPELVELGGGEPLASRPGAPAARTTWAAVAAAEPEVLILAPCGFPLERTRAEVPALLRLPEWRALPAVRNGRVYAVDGHAYLSRPGPRIVEAAAILAGLIQPGYCASLLPETGWERVAPG